MIVDTISNNRETSERYTQMGSEVSRFERQLLAINTITAVINRSTDLNRILNTTLVETYAALNLRHSAIWLWDSRAMQLRPRNYHGLPDSLIQELADSEAALHEPIGAKADQTSLIHDLTGLLQHHAERYKLPYVLNIPLMAQQQLVGVLTFFSQDASSFTLETKACLNTIANLVGTAIYNMRLFEQVQNYASNLEAEVAVRTTDLRTANEKLKTARDLANEASRAKSVFLANMSHELRTPLNAILGYSELLQDEAQDLNQPDFVPPLQKIHSAGKHLLNLISDILDLSKIEAGKMQLYPENFKISNMVDEVVNTSSPLIEKNSNALQVLYADNLGLMWADMTKVRQVLFNLLSNACKFTEKGQIKLEVSRQTINGGDWINFRVTDTGIGMSAEQLKKLFKEFSQADPSTTRKYGGTGLGLVISQRFSQMMGGNITVKSELGKGSVFLIRLPAHLPGSEIPPFREEAEVPPFLDEE